MGNHHWVAVSTSSECPEHTTGGRLGRRRSARNRVLVCGCRTVRTLLRQQADSVRRTHEGSEGRHHAAFQRVGMGCRRLRIGEAAQRQGTDCGSLCGLQATGIRHYLQHPSHSLLDIRHQLRFGLRRLGGEHWLCRLRPGRPSRTVCAQQGVQCRNGQTACGDNPSGQPGGGLCTLDPSHQCDVEVVVAHRGRRGRGLAPRVNIG